MSYSSTTTRTKGNIARCMALLTFLTGVSIASSFAQETPPPPEKATPAEVAECEEEWMKRSGTVDLGGSQYRDRIRDLCNTSVYDAPETVSGEEPATNDYFVSGRNNSGFVYELSDECQQVRLENELIYICPEGSFKPTIRNNQSGFMPYKAPETP
ncbi:hypothetical protein GCM10007094_13920 [Pseudovibrio japonicus]|uniref:Uncharacterized protein n=1 Tax=Pseudovibrio japonicus TaxID=366534 RepID=A0ABQ3E5N8_9HYPH|nr:hypothetical protein [Pseudovibrio japonicus]GHB26834.1 hypothetical protein GCM10007094_13920 [Pseudovibrio japonicus]